MINSLLGGRYKLGEMIGTGGMADVYIAEDTRLARQVAVKVLRSDLARDPSFVARFRKEALAAAGLNHPGIVAVYDSGEEPAPYIVMELITGHTLRELIHKGERIPLNRALEIGEGILAALEYSHHSGIVHRDIKPANIMITDHGDVKVMDFGIARALADLGATLTSTWNVVGTAQYLSPEQALGEVADLRSDIYSTGCLLYEVLTGKPPFTGETPVSIAYQHVSGNLVAPSSIVPELPAGVDTLLTVALAKNPDDRYQSAGLMLDDLYKIKSGEVVTTKISKPPVSRRKVVIGAVSGIAALALLITGLFVARPSTDPATLPQLPNVVGLTQAEAEALLGDYIVTITRAYDGRIPKDRVASQTPLATVRVQKGSGVVLTISDGPGNSVVPIDLVGMSLIDARSALTSVGLLVTSIEAVPSDEAQGTVLKVTPVPGSTITAGSGVVLEIASGQVLVPTLIGTDALQAKTLLVQAGFLVNEIFGYDPNQPIGIVIRQAPDAGTTQTIGKSVTITINKAP
jgi:eukaryotic-like serine/threonine-protein kinase